MPLLMQYEQPGDTLPFNLMTPIQHEWTVAVAEDPFVRRYIRALLAKHGFRIAENDTPLTRKLIESGQLKPDVLITNDPTTFAAFAGDLPVLYLAAAPDPALVERFRLCRMLRKPFQSEQLVQAVSELAAAAWA
ncbi:MAG TPA: hypothetical protein VME43_19775 [Bryobacteraceae bacterium]|nr:hypothetical protein [Bryobacteraceae bacterium]